MFFDQLVDDVCRVETRLVSVERITEYTEGEREVQFTVFYKKNCKISNKRTE